MTLDACTAAARIAGDALICIVELELLVDEDFGDDDKLVTDVELARTGILSALERLNRRALDGPLITGAAE